MNELKVELEDLNVLVPYVNNAKIHTDTQVEQIAKSIKDFGFNDPIAAWHNKNGEPEIVEGHGRVMAAKLLGLARVPVIYLDSLTDEQRRAYTHTHNQTAMNSGFDLSILMPDLEELSGSLDLDFGEFGFDDFLGGEDEEDEKTVENEEMELDPKYSDNIGKVIYEPRETNHKVSDLFSLDRADLDEKIAAIENEELRNMLEIRKYWFCEFNFAKIADYYAYQATPTEQRALEALGMVLLDRDQLIENGFTNIIDAI